MRPSSTLLQNTMVMMRNATVVVVSFECFWAQSPLVRMIEPGDGFDYAVLFFVGEFRVNRQGENFEAGFFGDWKLAGVVAQMFERVLQVQAEGVVDF